VQVEVSASADRDIALQSAANRRHLGDRVAVIFPAMAGAADEQAV